MPEKSSSSVVIKSVDPQAIQSAIEAYVEELQNRYPEVERLYWFGSWVSGLPTPGSDVDLCLILSSSQERPRDRISRYLPSRFPVGIDLFAYTRDEFDRLRKDSPQWFAAITSGREIHVRI